MRTFLMFGSMLMLLVGHGGTVPGTPLQVPSSHEPKECPPGTTYCSGTCGGGACLAIPPGASCPTIPTCW